jgi:hypothetical protein
VAIARPRLTGGSRVEGPYLGAKPTLAPKVAAACAKVAAAQAKLVAAFKRKHPKNAEAPKDALGECFPAANGEAWVFELVSIGPLTKPASSNDILTGHEGSWRASYVTAEGKLVGEKTPRPLLLDMSALHAIGPYLRLVHDVDGDGKAEIILVNGTSWPDSHEGAGEMLTARGGVVTAYAPAAKVQDGGPIDVDGDGRVDFQLEPVTSVVTPCGMDGITYGGPPLVAHGLADGTFSTDDAVARESVRAGCADVPSRPLATENGQRGGPMLDPEVMAMRISCSRLRGETASAIEAELDVELPVVTGEPPEGFSTSACITPALARLLATQAPPFTIDACP